MSKNLWWLLSEKVDFSYGVTSWNKFVIAKWSFDEFGSVIYIYLSMCVCFFAYNKEINENRLMLRTI